jgi:hypothetical protein
VFGGSKITTWGPPVIYQEKRYPTEEDHAEFYDEEEEFFKEASDFETDQMEYLSSLQKDPNIKCKSLTMDCLHSVRCSAMPWKLYRKRTTYDVLVRFI